MSYFAPYPPLAAEKRVPPRQRGSSSSGTISAGIDDELFSALSAYELKTFRTLLAKVAADRDPRCSP